MVTFDASNVMPTSIVPLIDPALDLKLVMLTGNWCTIFCFIKVEMMKSTRNIYVLVMQDVMILVIPVVNTSSGQ